MWPFNIACTTSTTCFAGFASDQPHMWLCLVLSCVDEFGGNVPLLNVKSPMGGSWLRRSCRASRAIDQSNTSDLNTDGLVVQKQQGGEAFLHD